MRISFRIHYHTQWGQQIAVVGATEALGEWQPAQALRLQYLEDGHWGLSMDVPAGATELAYRYLLLDDTNRVLDEDWGAPRQLKLPARRNAHWVVQDSWRSQQHDENAYFSSAFQEVIFKADAYTGKVVRPKKNSPLLRFQIYCPRVQQGQRLCVLGNTEALGNWELNKAVLLGNEAHPLWTASIFVPTSPVVEYKYGIYDTAKKQLVYLEAGPNRVLSIDQLPTDAELIQQTDGYFKHPAGPWKGAGVAIPVFALRTADSFGVGAFTDIKKLVDWSAEVGLRLVQILPVNDTIARKSWVDSYPYAAISVFALHPIYLDVTAIDGFKKVVNRQNYKVLSEQLNALPEVDYEEVLAHKLKLARQIFDSEKIKFLKSTRFKNFLKENEHWLKAYAWFCYLRDQNGTADFTQWKTDKQFKQARLDKASDPKSKAFDTISFYYFLQYYLDRQLREAADYARSKGLILKGDIPIGIYRYSVDAWVAPRLYHMDGQAGAPPDPFSEIGQNWGFPTYNWAEMAKDGYQWWQQRLQQLSRYFDTFRIDHILGFFRIWEIPTEQVEGTMGYFNPALPIYLQEFSERGIHFDRERFCTPYLPEGLIDECFADEAAFVKKQFLSVKNPGYFQFKKAYATQRKVEAYFAKKTNQKRAHLKEGLYQLISNVLFFEDAQLGKTYFHPRIDFQNTASFQALDAPTRHQLEALYNDYFYKRQEAFWQKEAMRKLPAIKAATNMLICGEDLGMVPACVPGVMKALGFLTLEIQRMSKNPQTEFLQAYDIPYLSVSSPSTHDMAPIRLWWEESRWDQIQRFYNNELGMHGLHPEHCEAYVAEAIIRQHLHWPSMWTIFPLQDLLAMSEPLRRENPAEERINVPANPQHYWRYRMHLKVENLLKVSAFNEQLKRMFQESGRFTNPANT